MKGGYHGIRYRFRAPDQRSQWPRRPGDPGGSDLDGGHRLSERKYHLGYFVPLMRTAGRADLWRSEF